MNNAIVHIKPKERKADKTEVKEAFKRFLVEHFGITDFDLIESIIREEKGNVHESTGDRLKNEEEQEKERFLWMVRSYVRYKAKPERLKAFCKQKGWDSWGDIRRAMNCRYTYGYIANIVKGRQLASLDFIRSFSDGAGLHDREILNLFDEVRVNPDDFSPNHKKWNMAKNLYGNGGLKIESALTDRFTYK